MAITLVTGFPRNGKSYEVVRKMAEDFPDRKKYAINFDGLDFATLGVHPLDIEDWQTAEDGSVIFVDEVWQFFEAAGPHVKRKEYVRQLALHGHKGLDLFLVTQGAFQVDVFVRQLVEWHEHIIRPFGMPFYNIRRFRGIDRDPEASDARKRTIETKRKNRFKPEIWRYYTSAGVHNVKMRIPFKLVGGVLVLLAFVFFAVKTGLWFASMGDRGKEPGLLSTAAAAGQSVAASGVGGMFDISDSLLKATGQTRERLMVGTPQYDSLIQDALAKYFLGERELIEGAPWTAAKWADVMKPVTFPKPHCVLMPEKNKCVCHSQQGTRMGVSFSICSGLAVGGWFDPSKKDDVDVQKAVAAPGSVDQNQLRLAEQFGRQEAGKQGRPERERREMPPRRLHWRIEEGKHTLEGL